MATYLWYNFFNNCFIASWGFIMFKNLKSKLESKIETKLKSAVVEQPARPLYNTIGVTIRIRYK